MDRLEDVARTITWPPCKSYQPRPRACGEQASLRIPAGPGEVLDLPGPIVCLANGDVLAADGSILYRLAEKRGPHGVEFQTRMVANLFVTHVSSTVWGGTYVRDLEVHPCSALCTVHFNAFNAVGDPPVVVDLRTGNVTPVEAYGTVTTGPDHYDYLGYERMRLVYSMPYFWDNAGARGGAPTPGQSAVHPGGYKILTYAGCCHLFVEKSGRLAIFGGWPKGRHACPRLGCPESVAVCESGTLVMSSNDYGENVIGIVPPGGEPRYVDLPCNQFNAFDEHALRRDRGRLAVAVAVDRRGHLWLSGCDGVYMVRGCGLDAGYHPWSTTVERAFWSITVHQTLCVPRARAAVWAVLLSGERMAASEDAPAELPSELWVSIVEFVMVSRLGAHAVQV